MKKFLLGSVGLVAMLAGPAMAADMPIKAPPPPPVAYYDWTGAYIGFNVGETWYDVDRTFPNDFRSGGLTPGSRGNFGTSDSDGIFGFHAGAQWQWGAWVIGAEAALSGCFRECRSTTALAGQPLFNVNTAGEHKITNLFTVGRRLGYAWDRLMIFATGGWASANLKGQYCSTVTGVCGSTSQTMRGSENGASRNDGWYVGGGFDYMVHKGPLVDVLLGVEYQHYDVGAKSAFCDRGCAVPTGADYDLSAKGDIVRARLTVKTQGYRFFY
jgi:outer membrane immunogenic protein